MNAVACVVRLQVGRMPMRKEAALASWYNSALTLLEALLPWVLAIAAITPLAIIGGLIFILWRIPRAIRARAGEFFHTRWIAMFAAWLAVNALALCLLRADPFQLNVWWW
jgi:uncharacterized membrane protein